MAQMQQSAAQQAQMANIANRMACVKAGVNMWQAIFQQTIPGSAKGVTLNVSPRNVGLVKRFLVEITGTVAQAAGETLTRTPFGAANVLSNVVFTDLNNQTRIQTTGSHLALLASARSGLSFGSAFTNDAPMSFGSNYAVMTMPTPVTTAQNFRMFYDIPISYSDTDMRGSIFASVVNSTMNLQLTINPNFIVGSGAGGIAVQGAVYGSSTANDVGTLTNVTVTVYQNYLDQLPVDPASGRPMLPLLDMATNYLLNNTVTTGIAVGQDNTIPFANFRSFLSTFAVYNNPNNAAGTDITYWGLQSANYTNILKYDPYVSALLTRQAFHDDPPAGCYYFNFRDKPLETVQYGNLQLLFNPSTAGALSQMQVFYEQLALANVVTQAGSLYSN